MFNLRGCTRSTFQSRARKEAVRQHRNDRSLTAQIIPTHLTHALSDRTAAGGPVLWAALWPAATVLLVLAGSLSPFSFDLSAARANGGWGPAAIGWSQSGIADVATNVLVYLPVGAAICLWLLRRFGFCWAALAAAVMGGGASVLAESLQTLIPVRTASWVDVQVNIAGALAGALVAPALAAGARAIATRLRMATATGPMSTAASLAAVGLLVAGLWPFDFVSTTAELHSSLAASRWVPLVTTLDDVPPVQLHQTVPPAVGFVAMFAAFGFLTALAERESGRSQRSSIELAIGHAVILALMIETAQLFVTSRSFATLDAVLNTLGAGLGSYLAVFAVDAPSRSCWVGRPWVLLQPVLLVPVLLIQVAYRILGAVEFAQQGQSAVRESAVLWLPFSAYYGRPLTSVLAEAVSVCGGSALLALTVAGLAHALEVRARWWIAAAAATGLAALTEMIQFYGGTHVADLTDPLLAAAGAALAAVLWQAVRDAGPVTNPIPQPRSY